MAVTPNSFIAPQAPMLGLVQIANADSTGLKTVVTAGTNGTKVTGINVAGDDTVARDVQIGITRSATFYPLATATIPVTAGTIAATPPVNLLAAIAGLPVDNDGQPYLLLKSGDTLQVKALVTVTSGKLISVAAIGGDF